MKNKTLLYFFILFPVILMSCSKDANVRKLGNKLCDCGEPIVQWRKELEKNPAVLKQENEIRNKLTECLTPDRNLYLKYEKDTDFRTKLNTYISEHCVELNSSVGPMLQILADEKKEK